MTLTRIDDKAALIVIDLQQALTTAQTIHPVGDVVGRASRLAAAFRARAQRYPDHHADMGRLPQHPLDDHLRGLGVTQVVLAGVATSIGVESTARAAHEHGYHVVLVTDAMTDGSADAHHNSITRIFPRLGETATTKRSWNTSASPARPSRTALNNADPVSGRSGRLPVHAARQQG
jgi:nicotinamidase-related amidase